MLKEADIKDVVDWQIYQRGRSYFQNGRVLKIKQISKNQWIVHVQGSQRKPYVVEVDLEDEEYPEGDCNCPYWDTCKHFVAALLAIRHEQLKHRAKPVIPPMDWKSRLEKINVSDFQNVQEQKSPLSVKISLSFSESVPRLVLTLYSLCDVYGNLRKSKTGVTIHYFNQFNYGSTIKAKKNWPRTSELEREFLMAVNEHCEPIGKGSYIVPEEEINNFLLMLQKFPNIFQEDGNKANITQKPLYWKCELTKDAENYCIQALIFEDDSKIMSSLPLFGTPTWTFYQGQYRPVKGIPEEEAFAALHTHPLKIPEKEKEIFFEHYFENINNYIPLVISPKVKEEFYETNPKPYLLLSEEGGNLIAEVWFAYGDGVPQVNPSTNSAYVKGLINDQPYWLKRRLSQENDLLIKAKELIGIQISSRTMLEGWEGIKFVKSVILLRDMGWIVQGQESLRKYKLKKASIRTDINSGIDWFEIEKVKINDCDIPLKSIITLAHQNGVIALPDGNWVEFDEDSCKKFLETIQSISRVAIKEDDKHRLGHYHAPLIQELLEVTKEESALRNRLRKYTNYKEMTPVAVPKQVKTKLRPYQEEGLNWLWFLRQNNFGGILADDMGLGKTIQALALLQLDRNAGSKYPNLVIAPASVTENWYNEIKTNTPQLKPILFTGAERKAEFSRITKFDIVITSYPLLLRDITVLYSIKWNYIILDESQKIKNVNTNSYKIVHQLKAKHKLCMTGTPIENNLLEIWAQYSFLMPGLLGNMHAFKEDYIANQENSDVLLRLKRKINPFILRRTKENVELELPPKTEETIILEMGAAQQHVYDRIFKYYQQRVLESLQNESLVKTQFFVLQALTKLRLACLHPKLTKIPRNKINDSVKLETLMNFLDEIISEKHRVVVFSQFVSFFSIVQKALNNENIDFCYLDGKTPQNERLSLVNRFNNGKMPVFLLSLKAGGTGLNITGADYVIHLDPWWNPAVENQATDRTHRIGQTKPVFVYKFIAKNTVEEKILVLKERKQKLVHEMLDAAGLQKNLTKADIEAIFK